MAQVTANSCLRVLTLRLKIYDAIFEKSNFADASGGERELRT